ncbi:hypothetical protein L1987_59659 [Smallanthus sonchifolius]|uniref:Uncharacterized protein n=1 Tax=Smallanthus sonchifolius TaxID=185202 RepID=A0ACB9D6B2_9ASTR|nr:hypothetical protein L1987_59659 [Smallanthus sonchifolius]
MYKMFTLLQTDVIVQLLECRQHLDLLLESIPTMFQNNKTADSAFGAGINVLTSLEGNFWEMQETTEDLSEGDRNHFVVVKEAHSTSTMANARDIPHLAWTSKLVILYSPLPAASLISFSVIRSQHQVA